MNRTGKIIGVFLKIVSALIFTGMLCLSGCGSGDDIAPNHDSFSSPKKAEPQVPDACYKSPSCPDKFSDKSLSLVYDFQNMVDPFVVPLVAPVALPLDRLQSSSGSLETTGREFSGSTALLESLDMDSLRLTAIISTPDQRIALLEEPDGKGHELRIGMTVGRNRGQVTEIFQDRILIREISPDGTEHLRKVNLHEDTEE